MVNISKKSNKVNFEFDESKHQFKLNGLVIPSVTQIIGAAGLSDLSFIPKDILMAAADKGTKVHKTTELYDAGTLDLATLHPILHNYLDQWIKFKKDFDFVPIHSELKLVHPLYRYGGIIDRIGTVRQKLSLIDIKSGGRFKTHDIQSAAYELMYNHDKPKADQVKQRILVYLTENSYKVEINKNPMDKNVFLSALTIFNYLKS